MHFEYVLSITSVYNPWPLGLKRRVCFAEFGLSVGLTAMVARTLLDIVAATET
jgi:hypothetical protein